MIRPRIVNRVARFLGVVALAAAATLVLSLASAARAGELEARMGNDWVRVSDTPCLYTAVLRHIPEEYRSQFHKAQGNFGGTLYFACWRPQGDVLHLVYEDGDHGVVPSQELQPVQGR